MRFSGARETPWSVPRFDCSTLARTGAFVGGWTRCVGSSRRRVTATLRRSSMSGRGVRKSILHPPPMPLSLYSPRFDDHALTLFTASLAYGRRRRNISSSFFRLTSFAELFGRVLASARFVSRRLATNNLCALTFLLTHGRSQSSHASPSCSCSRRRARARSNRPTP